MSGFAGAVFEDVWLWCFAAALTIAESVLWISIGLWLLYRVQPTRRLLRRLERAVELYLRGNRAKGTG